ncbi:5'/3'-nucleotidase SurE [Geitlerinema sp. PCC 9228]|uniref:5'/3'-nucleotidase SurE n=1 Tax=Geitlerinema sp. PCC 9228 TaxID=111611 RepID=UPI0008F998E0|nr:5'/3'-nucleotidase SurE [Geitlerinema sp. PCC 9228]
MRILIGNDDGIHAVGVHALAEALAEAGHDITVVCPDRERSATGHSLTLHQPIRAQAVTSGFREGIQAWSCSGTPADCIKLALDALVSQPPQLVLSGINQGQNLGTDILYSGTVSAAMEGSIEGISSIAMSLASYTSQDFQPAAQFACKLVADLQSQALPVGTLLNVNVPPVPAAEFAGVVWARQGVRRYVDVFEKRVDPRGKTYYWIAGEVVEEGADAIAKDLPEDLPADVEAIQKNYITITPLHYNLTCKNRLEQLRSRQFQVF